MEIDVVHFIRFARFKRFGTKLTNVRMNIAMDSVYMTSEKPYNNESETAYVAFKLFVFVLHMIDCIRKNDQNYISTFLSFMMAFQRTFHVRSQHVAFGEFLFTRFALELSLFVWRMYVSNVISKTDFIGEAFLAKRTSENG